MLYGDDGEEGTFKQQNPRHCIIMMILATKAFARRGVIWVALPYKSNYVLQDLTRAHDRPIPRVAAKLVLAEFQQEIDLCLVKFTK